MDLARIGAVAAMACIIGAAAGAHAGEVCPDAAAPIATDRPDITNSSLVVPKGSLQAENGINLVARGTARALDGTNTRLRLGVGRCTELLLDVPSYVAGLRGDAASGFSAAAPALKRQLDAMPGGFTLSLTAGLGLPTGSTRIAGRGYQPYLQGLWGRELSDGWGLSGMITAFFRPSDPDARRVIEPTFVVEKEIGDRAGLFIEYVADAPERGPTSHLFNSGGLYRLTPTQQIDFHAGAGLNDAAPDWFVGVGYSIRLDGLF